MVQLLLNHKITTYPTCAHPQWREATQMQMVRLLFNHKIKPFPTSTHPQWREATSLQRVREFIRPSRQLERTPPHSHRRKTIQMHTMQSFNCKFFSSQKTHEVAHKRSAGSNTLKRHMTKHCCFAIKWRPRCSILVADYLSMFLCLDSFWGPVASQTFLFHFCFCEIPE